MTAEMRGYNARLAGLSLAMMLLAGVEPVVMAKSPDGAPLQDVAAVPRYFVENLGQLRPQVKYYETRAGYTAYFTSDGVYLVLSRPGTADAGAQRSDAKHVIRLAPVGANAAAIITGDSRQRAVVSYMTGNDPEQWKTGIPTWGAVVYKEIYPGIDLKYYGMGDRLEYDAIVHPGADSRRLRFAYEGIDALRVNAAGELEIAVGDQVIRQSRPYVYQEIGGRRIEREARFVEEQRFRYHFEIAGYDPAHTLVIDPGLIFSSYLGGSNGQDGSFTFGSEGGIAVAADGYVYVTGQAGSTDFPTTVGAVNVAPVDGSNVFVSKFSPDGSTLIYSAVFGGSSTDSVQDIEVDASGNAYVAGATTSANFPTTTGAYDRTYNAGPGTRWDMFVARLNADGTALLYSSYFGGTLDDGGNNFDAAMALGPDGDVYIAGRTISTDLPTTPGAFDTTYNGALINGRLADAFVARLRPAGNGAGDLIYATYLGGTFDDWASGIAVDGNGRAYVAGVTRAGDFPVTAGAYDTVEAGGDTAPYRTFLTVLDPSGAALAYSTYLGGGTSAPTEAPVSVAVSPAGMATMAIRAISPFPVTAGAFDTTFDVGTGDVVVMRIDPAGNAAADLVYATYIGGSESDVPRDLFVDSAGNAYVAGYTQSCDFPTTATAFRNKLTPPQFGSSDVFVARLDTSGSCLHYGSYLGGAGIDVANGVAANTSGDAYVNGQTNSADFPTTAGAYDTAYNGFFDAFVSRFDVGGSVCTALAMPVADAGADQTANEGSIVTLDGSASTAPGCQGLTYTWTQLAGPVVSLGVDDPAHPVFTAPVVSSGGATLTFQLTVSNGTDTSPPDTVDITVKNVNNPPVADAGADQVVNEGSPVMLDGAASYDADNEPLTYSWLQTAGSPVTLSDPALAQLAFTAPAVGIAGTTVTFQLTVSDGIDSATDSVDIRIEHVNHAPVADAGPDQTVDENTVVTLDGSGSSDPDNDTLSYQWTQTGGTAVTLLGAGGIHPVFTAPAAGAGGETLMFSLSVSDGELASTDTVDIAVRDANDPPLCNLAVANPPGLWPPNHKMIPVVINGVSDPDNDQTTITITGVRQDEPVNGLGDGDTAPDAVIQGDVVLLRAERSGTGNGRVYHASFVSNDGQGGVCQGSVAVSVPHDRQGPAVDDGPVYESTQP